MKNNFPSNDSSESKTTESHMDWEQGWSGGENEVFVLSTLLCIAWFYPECGHKELSVRGNLMGTGPLDKKDLTQVGRWVTISIGMETVSLPLSVREY